MLADKLSYAIEEALAHYTGDLELESSPDNLSKRFNFYSRFEYAVDEEEIYVKMRKDTFREFEYYLGMEYNRDNIVFKIEFDNEVHVVYDGSERLFSVLEIEEQ